MTAVTPTEPIEPETLTPMLRQVLLLRVAGASTVEIARELGVAQSTVRTYIKRAYRTRAVVLLDKATGRPVRGARLAYVLGLLDGGASLSDVPGYVERLDARAYASWRGGRPACPQTAPLADPDEDDPCDTAANDCRAA